MKNSENKQNQSPEELHNACTDTNESKQEAENNSHEKSINELQEANQVAINSSYPEIQAIYVNYRLVVRPFIAVLELFDQNFPVEILNEIRAIFQHLSRCYYCPGYDEAPINIKKEISKAKSHMGRALFDCFKYSCLSIYDEYTKFKKAFKNVDLSTVDDGKFLPELHRLSQSAKCADKKARKLEADTGDKGEVFKLYEDAFNKSYELYTYINMHIEYAVKLKRKFIFQNFFAVLGWIIGIVSGIITIAQHYGNNIVNFFSSLI